MKRDTMTTTTTTELTQAEFLSRFKAQLLKYAEQFDDGTPVDVYADQIGPTYWEDPEMRAEGPEECARADMDEWR